MSRLRKLQYFSLALVAVVGGGMTYALFDQARYDEAAGVGTMVALVAFFMFGDVHVNELYERDALKAKREAHDWDSY